MRLRRLWIEEFKNLKAFEIKYDDVFTSVLVGPNGTGKSNVLEALIVIFRDLDLGVPSPFAYELEYNCRGAEIVIKATSNRKKTPDITVDGRPIILRNFSRQGGGEYLPSFLFGYYSGPSNRMQSHFEPHQRKFASALLEGNDRPLRPLLYARLVHSQFVLLSFFQNETEDRKILSSFLNIEDLESVLFVLKKPKWFNRTRKSSDSDNGDPRFWGARGVVSDFLKRLHCLSLAPLHSKTGDHLYLFLKNKHDLMTLAENFHGHQEFFKSLESLYISDLIEDVRTSVKIKGSENPLTFNELSEGEQQLLMVIGLLRFVEEQEGLILLDEPDTHLNPAWSIMYTTLLKDNVANRSTSQILLTTHDPLVIAGLTSQEVHIMNRSEQTGQISAFHPDDNPRGMGFAALLTSELYGLRSSLDIETMKDLDRKRQLAIKVQPTEEDLHELGVLNERLGQLDFTNTMRDPLYKPFVAAMSRLERELGLNTTVKSPEQLLKHKQLSEIVLRTIAKNLM